MNSGSGIPICAISDQEPIPPMAITTIKYRIAGTNSAESMIFHIFDTGKFVSSIMVGVISNPMNFSENTAMAINMPLKPLGKNPPCPTRLSVDQCPLNSKVMLTMRDMMIIVKKQILASFPVKAILKLDRMYHSRTMPMAIHICAPLGIGIKYWNAVMKINAIIGGSTTCMRNIIHWEAHPALCPKALVVQMSTEEAKGSIAVSSAKARPTGTSSTARIGKINAAPAPVTENQ